MLHRHHEQNYVRLYTITYELPIHKPLSTISVPDIQIPRVIQESNNESVCLPHNSSILIATVEKLLTVKAMS